MSTATEPIATGTPVVAWVDRPAPRYVAPTSSLPVADARPCGAHDVRISVGNSGAAMGNINTPLTLLNVSSSSCSLSGYPTLVFIDAEGRHHEIGIRRGSYFGDPGPPANVEPGRTGALNISGGDGCEASFTRHRVDPTLLVGLPDGSSAAVDGRQVDTICGVSVSAFGVPSSAPSRAEIPPLPITVAISAPPSVAAGKTLAFVVTLSNATGHDFSLNPCPSYDEFLGSGSSRPWVATVRDYFLNCDAIRSIPAGGSVRFEMRLVLPPDQPAGSAKFGWSLQGDRGPSAAAPLEVRGRELVPCCLGVPR